MRGFLPFLMVFLLCSCDLLDMKVLDGEKAASDRNTFVIQQEYEEPSSFTVLLTSDLHFLRDDDGVYYKDTLFFDWVTQYQAEHPTSETNLTHMVSLGDITENSSTEEFKLFSDFKEKLAVQGITTYAIKGNHDIRPGKGHLADWKRYVGQYTYEAIAHRGVSFYFLNTASRTLGRIQMHELQAAVKMDDKRPKIFFSHMPLYGKSSLIYLVLVDAQERENLIRLMVENKGMLFLAGHHHQGDVQHSFRKTTSEFILGAFHGREMFFEQIKPRWYLLFFSTDDKTITITRYQVESDESISEQRMASFPVEL